MAPISLDEAHQRRVLGVGIIGCGEITQVAHIPTLGFLSDYFRVTYLSDISDQALEHSRHKIIGEIPKTTRDPKQLCASPMVDVVIVASADEYHADQAILALGHEKTVFVEKPLALNMNDIRRLKDAERASRGTVMVGYMRRYAAAFQDAVQRVGEVDKVLYARVRGPNTPSTEPLQTVNYSTRHHWPEQRLREPVRNISQAVCRYSARGPRGETCEG